jgi:SAM-dependent methyltransferase
VMAGQGLPFGHVIRDALRIYRKHRRHTRTEAARYYQRYLALTELLMRHTGARPAGARVMGCGQRAAIPLLFAANGADATAIDVEAPTYDMNVRTFSRVWRANGAERALKSAVRNLVFDRRFFRELVRVSAVGLSPFPPIHVHTGDAAELRLPSDHYHLVFSFEVLEHVANIEAVVRNLNDWLHPDGVAHVVVHLFPSLSGGHCMDWNLAFDPGPPEYTTPLRIPPWDHLLETRYPANVFLNRLGMSDYRDVFRRFMTVIDERTVREGQELLHLAPRELLLRYSDEELTTSKLVLTLRKKRAQTLPSERATDGARARLPQETGGDHGP